MKLGTVVYDGKIYNLDYMTTDEVKKLLAAVESKRKEDFRDIKGLVEKETKEEA